MDAGTISLHEDVDRERETGAFLYVLLQADRPIAAASRHSLGGLDRVALGRGETRRFERTVERGPGGLGRVLRVVMPDAAMSGQHARLVRDGDAWWFEEAGSKNGSLVNGVAAGRLELADGDLLELGRSFFLFRTDIVREGPADVLAGSEGLITLSPELELSLAACDRVAPSAISVLILGESGTGKEVLARSIHERSGRRGEFVAVNCGALPATLVESQLFGHRKGAFTGAAEDRPGFIRAADRGTLFLDEIGDLPVAAQASFLRVLQEREVVAVGDTRPTKVDLRVLAATHQDLEGLTRTGAFREDLYARLCGLTVELPPLRQRREDLGALIGGLLARIAPSASFTAGAARALLRYEWPLNVRELERCLEAAAVLAPGAAITLEALPPAVREARPPTRSPTPAADRQPELVRLLGEHRGNVSAVARDMRTTRSQIHRMLKRFAIDLATFRKD